VRARKPRCHPEWTKAGAHGDKCDFPATTCAPIRFPCGCAAGSASGTSEKPIACIDRRGLLNSVARMWFFSFQHQPRSGSAAKPNLTWRGEARNERGFHGSRRTGYRFRCLRGFPCRRRLHQQVSLGSRWAGARISSPGLWSFGYTEESRIPVSHSVFAAVVLWGSQIFSWRTGSSGLLSTARPCAGAQSCCFATSCADRCASNIPSVVNSH
jgi:hypothetical protein